jgi:O-antigen ligase
MQSIPEQPPLVRAALASAAVLIVAGSHLGMLWLASVYVELGRIASMLSPEAVIGALAILVAILAVMGQPAEGGSPGRMWTVRWFAVFTLVAAAGELLRPDRQLSNVPTFLALLGYLLVGIAVGRRLAAPAGRLPFAPALIVIYAIWYLGLLIFYAQGHLGFFGELPDSDLARLEFSSGFRATELPIYVGFHFPVLLHVLFSPYPFLLRLMAGLLTVCALVLVILSASVAAIVALFLIGLVFVFAHRGLSLRRVMAVVAVTTVLAVGATASSSGIAASAQGKLLNFAEGEGVRALIYAELVANIIEQPSGIGKGRFVETNSFSWLGEGVYPHQNVLGIGAELGVVAMALFVLFMLAGIAALTRKAWSRRTALPPAARQLIAIGLAVFLYQQFRGLFQDTWVVKETYFWLGMAMGVMAAHWRAVSPPQAEARIEEAACSSQ